MLELNRIEGATREHEGYGGDWKIPSDAKILPPRSRNDLKSLHSFKKTGGPGPRIVGIYNQAGGAGKTSLTRDLSYLAALWGLKVLAIDMDSQGSLTRWLGVDTKIRLEETIFPAIMEDDTLLPRFKTFGVDLVPSGLVLDALNAELFRRGYRQSFFRESLVKLPYDLIFLDGPPNITPVVGALMTSIHHLVVPVEVDRKGLEGLEGVYSVIKEFRGIAMVREPSVYVPTRFDPRSSEAKEYLEQIRNLGGDKVLSPIHSRVAAYIRATTEGKPIPYLLPSSDASNDIMRIAPMLLDRIGFEEVGRGR